MAKRNRKKKNSKRVQLGLEKKISDKSVGFGKPDFWIRVQAKNRDTEDLWLPMDGTRRGVSSHARDLIDNPDVKNITHVQVFPGHIKKGREPHRRDVLHSYERDEDFPVSEGELLINEDKDTEPKRKWVTISTGSISDGCANCKGNLQEIEDKLQLEDANADIRVERTG